MPCQVQFRLRDVLYDILMKKRERSILRDFFPDSCLFIYTLIVYVKSNNNNSLKNIAVYGTITNLNKFKDYSSKRFGNNKKIKDICNIFLKMMYIQ